MTIQPTDTAYTYMLYLTVTLAELAEMILPAIINLFPNNILVEEQGNSLYEWSSGKVIFSLLLLLHEG